MRVRRLHFEPPSRPSLTPTHQVVPPRRKTKPGPLPRNPVDGMSHAPRGSAASPPADECRYAPSTSRPQGNALCPPTPSHDCDSPFWRDQIKPHRSLGARQSVLVRVSRSRQQVIHQAASRADRQISARIVQKKHESGSFSKVFRTRSHHLHCSRGTPAQHLNMGLSLQSLGERRKHCWQTEKRTPPILSRHGLLASGLRYRQAKRADRWTLFTILPTPRP